MVLQKVLKNWKKWLIVLLVGTMFLSFIPISNIAKAELTQREKYKAIISLDVCKAFYTAHCTSAMGSPQDRNETLQEWYGEIKADVYPTDAEIESRMGLLKSACDSLNKLDKKTYDTVVGGLLNQSAGKGCIDWLGIREPSDDFDWNIGGGNTAPVEKAVSNDSRCPLETVKKFTVGQMFTSPIDTVLSLIPRLVTWLLEWAIKWFTRVLILFLTPNNVAENNTLFAGYSVKNQFVSESWKLTRDIANIMIMLLIFVVAINIIMRKKDFQNYQALVYLVVVAILINFSLVLCGMLIDISNYLTVFFIHNGNLENLECILVVTIQRISNVFKGTDSMILSQTLGYVLGMIIAVILCGQIVGLCIYVITRILTLWMLNIISPIAFVCYILPQTRKKYFQPWWNNFSGLLINLPLLCAAMFFILKLMNAVSKILGNIVDSGGGSVDVASVFGYGIMIIVLGQSMLTVASSLNVKSITKATSTAKNLITSGVIAGTSFLGKEGVKRVEKSQAFQAFTDKASASKIPFVAQWASGLSEKGLKTVNSSIDTGYKQASKVREQNGLGQLQYVENALAIGNKAEALGGLKKMKESLAAFKYFPADLKDKLPRYLKLVNDLSKDPVLKESTAVDDLKKLYPFIKFKEKIVDGKKVVDVNSIKDTMKEYGSKPEKLKDFDIFSTLAHIKTLEGENGEKNLDKIMLETLTDAWSSNTNTSRTFWSKPRPQDAPGFYKDYNQALVDAGLSPLQTYDKMHEEGARYTQSLTVGGRLLSIMDEGEKQKWIDKAKEKEATETQGTSSVAGPTVTSGGINNKKDILLAILNELQALNKNPQFTKGDTEKFNDAIGKLGIDIPDIAKINEAVGNVSTQKNLISTLEKVQTILNDKPRTITNNTILAKETDMAKEALMGVLNNSDISVLSQTLPDLIERMEKVNVSIDGTRNNILFSVLGNDANKKIDLFNKVNQEYKKVKGASLEETPSFKELSVSNPDLYNKIMDTNH